MTTSLAVAADLEALLPGVTDKVPAGLITTYLALDENTVGNVEVWGTDRSLAHALLALHGLSKAGHFATYGVEDPGEAGQLVQRTSAGTIFTFASPKQQDSDADTDKASTVWGRLYLQIWRRKRAVCAPLVLGLC
jgi:hypothetical protein